MLSKEAIEKLKQTNINRLYVYLDETQHDAELLHILKSLGRLPDEFAAATFLPLLSHANDDVRFWAAKNLGKIGDDTVLPVLIDHAKQEQDTLVRREVVAAIGRTRSAKNIDALIQFLQDDDPKVILQAIRGLLVFKKQTDVQQALEHIRKHPNEMIQMVLERELPVHEGTNPTETPMPHAESPDNLKNTVILGDVRDILPLVPDESIHLTFTSPPYYNARDYSIYPSYAAYLDFLTEVFQQVHRITKEGRFFILNTSPVIVPRFSRSYSSIRYPIPFDIHPRLVDIGWDFIDDIIWVKPEASVKNRNAGFLQHRKPLGYKPNAVTEYLMVYRKHTSKLIDWNMSQYDTETIESSKVDDDYETSNTWHIDPTFDKVHSAVFPKELCHRVITYYSYRGDLIFDPFGGSGTVGKAALELNRYYLLTEQHPPYFERMKDSLNTPTLFNPHSMRFITLDDFRSE